MKVTAISGRQASCGAFETFRRGLRRRSLACVSFEPTDLFAGGKSAALYFFSATPYGLTADELGAWIAFGGGQALWDGGRRAVQHQAADGLQYRRPDGRAGLTRKSTVRRTSRDCGTGCRNRAEVLRRMGATVVTTPGGEIVGRRSNTGAIDASEWVGPWLDMDARAR